MCIRDRHNRPDTFAFVPDLSVKRKWTDDELYKEFAITKEEQAYIASLIKPMVDSAALIDEDGDE